MKTENIAEKVRGYDSETITQSIQGKTAPEIWIGRQSSIYSDSYHDDWHIYADKLGRVNRGLGYAASLGSIAVTYVSATEMGRMIQEKYPKIHDDRKKMSNIVKRIAKDLNGYVRYQSHETVQEESDLLTRSYEILEYAREYNYDLDNPLYRYDYHELIEGGPKNLLGDFDGRIWGVADITLGELGIFGRDSLGFHIDDQIINQERNEIINYLRKDGFNVRKIDRDRKPHVATFHSFAPIPHTGLQVPASSPDLITLDEPKAITNHL